MEKAVLENTFLKVTVDPESVNAEVETAAGTRFEFTPNADGDADVRCGTVEARGYLRDAWPKTLHRTGRPGEKSLSLFLEGLPGGTGLMVTWALADDEPVLRVEIDELSSASDARFLQVRFPGQIAFKSGAPRFTVWPNCGGMLLADDYPKPVFENGEELERRMSFNRHLYQPWWGALGERGAYMAIAQTPFDFALDVMHPAGGPTRTRPYWINSLGKLGYPRAIRYRFFDEADHVTLARSYRAYAQEIRRWVSLEEKFERNPRLKSMLGMTIISMSICSRDNQSKPPAVTVTPFAQRAREIRRLKEIGRKKMMFHIDGWVKRGYDNIHPDILPPCLEAGGWDGLVELSKVAEECGYLFALHDQYRDYYFDGPRFSQARAVKNADGSYPVKSLWAGGPQTLLCAREALSDIRRNYAEILGRGARLSASYLDVYAVVPLDECYNPAHPMTREDCYRWRAAGLEHVRDLGIIMSSEEPVDCFVPHLDFAHWMTVPRTGFMKGDYVGIHVPLHTLVYHDALLLGCAYDYGWPENGPSEEYFLEGLARVEMPYGSAMRAWSERSDFQHTDILAGLHEIWGAKELVNHRLLDSGGLVQEYEYPDGAVTIDLAAYRYRIDGGPMDTRGFQSAPLGRTPRAAAEASN